MAISRVHFASTEPCAVLPERRWLRFIVKTQSSLTWWFDRLLPAEFQIDGNLHFLRHLMPSYLRPGALIYDVGGGRNPAITRRYKDDLGLRIVGLDIDHLQLAVAPAEHYDQTICTDIAGYRGRSEADLVICQSLLEHVPDTDRAIAAIATILRPGGRALIFVPCRNAVYARLNVVLPEAVKRHILYAVFPEMRRDHGFPAYYNRCTPAGLADLGKRHGLVVESSRSYFLSNYFRFCLPLHALWRLWLLLFRWIAGTEAAETFAIVFRKDS